MSKKFSAIYSNFDFLFQNDFHVDNIFAGSQRVLGSVLVSSLHFDCEFHKTLYQETKNH